MPAEALPAAPQELQGITINVYELEVQNDGGDVEREVPSNETSGHTISTISEEDGGNDGVSGGQALGISTMSTHELRYANITVVCSKCNGAVPVATLQYHGRRHRALQALRYSVHLPPMTTRGLLRRRNKAMNEVKRMVYEQEGQFIRVLRKIDDAYELLKAELQGMSVEQTPNFGRWRGKLFIYLTFFKHGSLSTTEGIKGTIKQTVAFHRAVHLSTLGKSIT